MRRFVIRRLLLVPVVLIGMTFTTFVISQVVPIDPAAAYLGSRGGAAPGQEEELVRQLSEKWGWDKPILERYGIYMSNLVQGDLGVSSTTRRPVADDLADYVPPTLELVIASMIVAIAIGIVLGVLSAAKRGRLTDTAVMVGTTLGVSVPTFWLALVGFNLFYGELGWAAGPGQLSLTTVSPPTVTGLLVVDSILAGRWDALQDALHHLAFPTLVLGLLIGLYFARVVRHEMIEVLESDYIRAAKGKGLRSSTVLVRHALRNAIIPLVTLSGLAFGSLLTGVVVVEYVVGWPGLGGYTFRAATKLDLNGITGVVLVTGIVYITVNLIVDLLYALIDPRVRVRYG
jgi:peptide/nickel transport system permease protein